MQTGNPRPDRVEIAWQDAARTDGWRSLKAIMDETPPTVHSLGYLVKNTSEYVTIVQSMDDSEGAADALTIPAPWVCEITLLLLDKGDKIMVGQPAQGVCNDYPNQATCASYACSCHGTTA